MSNKAISPSSCEGIKHLAKSLKTERGIQHVHTLDEAARNWPDSANNIRELLQANA